MSTRRVPRALELADRPDPALGLLETIRVEDGQARHVEAHLARLGASARELYGIDLPGDLAERIASIPGTGRLRVVLLPSGATRLDPSLLGAPSRHQRFAPFLLPGGLGAHKWADRRLNEALAHAARDAVPLLVDADGLVLETERTNVWIEEEGTLLTPPADGRILPGTTRARLLQAEPTAREEPISLERLLAAQRVLLSSSIAGIRPLGQMGLAQRSIRIEAGAVE